MGVKANANSLSLVYLDHDQGPVFNSGAGVRATDYLLHHIQVHFSNIIGILISFYVTCFDWLTALLESKQQISLEVYK